MSIAFMGQIRPVRLHVMRPLLAIRHFFGRLIPHLFTMIGFACIDTGAFTANRIAGFIVTGLTLLILDWKVTDGEIADR